MRRSCKFIFFLSGFIFPSLVGAAQVTLAWDHNCESNLAGYKLYYQVGFSGPPYNGIGLEQGNSPLVIPLVSLSDRNYPEIKLTGLAVGGESYYFVVTAYNDEGDESSFSNEVSYTVIELTQR
ncbi:MAG: fibronectin type III domain-containing protein [Deltaproteobacteria bacterium]|nr:fibronectin type III domain-containing protein [Deltaproteobacteria bacterium]